MLAALVRFSLKHRGIVVARWPRVIIAAALVVCVAAATRLPFFGGEFLPDFREGHLVLQVFATPGTSLPEMIRIGTQISKQLLANPRIDTVEQQVGRAELGEDPWGRIAPNSTSSSSRSPQRKRCRMKSARCWGNSRGSSLRC